MVCYRGLETVSGVGEGGGGVCVLEGGWACV